jgi:hypothetical protein
MLFYEELLTFLAKKETPPEGRGSWGSESKAISIA